MDNTRKGLASIDTEIKSAIAESNAELERFREEFGFIRGTLEETDFSRDQFRDDINELKEGIAEMNVQVSTLKSSADESEKSNTLSEGELRELITKLVLRIDTIERNYLLIDKDITALEDLVNDISVSGGAKKQLAEAEPGDLYMKGFEEASNGDYIQAAETLKSFLLKFPDHELSGDAQYWLSESYYGNGDWERAILEFNKVTKYYPSSEKVAPSLLKQGLSFSKLGLNKEATLILKRVISKHGDTPEAKEADRALKKLNSKSKKSKAKPSSKKKAAKKSAEPLPYPKLSPSTAGGGAE